MPDSNQRTPLTLEDLLRLKRAERPSPEFWSRFESELRRKQLAALLEVRPWWQRIPEVLAQPRMFIPLGATALIAFALVSSKLFVAERPASENDHLVAQAIQASPVRVSEVPAPTTSEAAPVVSVVAVTSDESEQRNTTSVVVALSEHLPEHAAGLTPWNAPIPARNPAAQLFAANVEQLERVPDPRLTSSLSNSPLPVATSGLQRSGGAVAELASVSALASKRTRLLAQMGDRQFAPEPQAPASIRERLTRRLADSSFTEHFTRIGLKGDQVSLRF